MLKEMQRIYNSLLFYGGALIFPISPGTLAWKLFKNKKGKIPLVKRDLICDTDTLMSLTKSENSLDEFTTAFTPFIPLLTLNGIPWKHRRSILANGLRKINLEKDFKIELPFKKGDVYWDFYEILFRIGFELVVGRPPTSIEFENMYPGIEDINLLIKRQIGFPNIDLRWKLYNQTVKLISQENENKEFIFFDNNDFKNLSEIDQISIIVEDLLTSICIQCTDLICHLILLYPSFKDDFNANLDNCINETLRLYPLTDIWTRKTIGQERGWIASLIQLNRTGWSDPDQFKPERWNTKDHPPLISWGFDARSCPASRVGYNLSKLIFQKIASNEDIWVQPAENYKHERTFTMGCQVWIGHGPKPDSLHWKYKDKWKKHIQQWLSSRFRVIDQKELW